MSSGGPAGMSAFAVGIGAWPAGTLGAPWNQVVVPSRRGRRWAQAPSTGTRRVRVLPALVMFARATLVPDDRSDDTRPGQTISCRRDPWLQVAVLIASCTRRARSGHWRDRRCKRLASTPTSTNRGHVVGGAGACGVAGEGFAFRGAVRHSGSHASVFMPPSPHRPARDRAPSSRAPRRGAGSRRHPDRR